MARMSNLEYQIAELGGTSADSDPMRAVRLAALVEERSSIERRIHVAMLLVAEDYGLMAGLGDEMIATATQLERLRERIREMDAETEASPCSLSPQLRGDIMETP